jgi:hypothetical protein
MANRVLSPIMPENEQTGTYIFRREQRKTSFAART